MLPVWGLVSLIYIYIFWTYLKWKSVSAHKTHSSTAMAVSIPSPISLRQMWLRWLCLSSQFRSGLGVVLARASKGQLWAQTAHCPAPEQGLKSLFTWNIVLSVVDPDPSSERRYYRWELAEALNLRPWEIGPPWKTWKLSSVECSISPWWYSLKNQCFFSSLLNFYNGLDWGVKWSVPCGIEASGAVI